MSVLARLCADGDDGTDCIDDDAPYGFDDNEVDDVGARIL